MLPSPQISNRDSLIYTLLLLLLLQQCTSHSISLKNKINKKKKKKKEADMVLPIQFQQTQINGKRANPVFRSVLQSRYQPQAPPLVSTKPYAFNDDKT
jgi:hypothetical protein